MNPYDENFFKKITDTFNVIQEIKNESKKNKRFGFDFPFDIFLYSMSLLTPQAYGTRLENFVIEKFNLQKVSSTDGLGDFQDSLCQKHELKVSLITSTNDSLNMVQLRTWQNIAGYLMVAFNLNVEPIKLYAFQLTKQQLIDEMVKMNASAAHGNKKANEKNTHVEKRMSLKIDDSDPNFKRWCKLYLNKELSEKFSK
jgi:hypothetical protein